MRNVLVTLLVALLGLACGESPAPPSVGNGDPADGTVDRSVFEPTESRLSPGTASGSARFEPARAAAAETGTFVLRFTVGDGGVQAGGHLLIDFPKTWFATRLPYPKPAQIDAPSAPHHISATASRPGVTLEIELQGISLDGKRERYPRMVHLGIRDRALEAGDEVRVELARTYAPFLAGAGSIQVAVDADGSGGYRLLAEPALYTIEPGPIASIHLFPPAQALIGETVDISLTAFDRFYNASTDLAGELSLRGLGGVDIPLGFDGRLGGRATARWTPTEAGFHWPEARGWATGGGGRLDGVAVAGGPVLVSAEPPKEQLYWGDLQTHSRISKDAIGEAAFEYAEEVTRLDVFALTPHSDDDGSWTLERDGITPAEWEWVREQAEGRHRPGLFVPLLAYECTLKGGHHCVYFEGTRGAPIAPRTVGWVERLWRRLPKGRAITVPHHLGRLTGVDLVAHGPGIDDLEFHLRADVETGPTLDWSQRHRPVYRPLLEIYSIHGSSELYAPEDPLAYENVGYLPSRSSPGPHYARDAWEAGLRMGVVGGSDNHTAQPGLAHTGLSGIFAPRLDRPAVFAALRARRTFATTGSRIQLRFRMAGASMGERALALGQVDGWVQVAAPSAIRSVEVFAYDRDGDAWRTAASWRDEGRLLEQRFEDLVAAVGTVYYVRVELEEPVGGRVARAWSSPIWIDPPTDSDAAGETAS